ncbi:hypothetical protein TNCT_454551 [Trichonephila clavata]|uniref:Uncharacterized protein n=1 Tax=Trichonephila clavata TaxID=2740835 RepID=A0A8X6HXV1_TRICU|nr:hypothetical protein TNCT_454551 [Trichonephila clavata]
MTEEGDLNFSKEPKEIDTEICMQTSPDETLLKGKESVDEINEAEDSNDQVSETPTSYNNELNHALDLSLEILRQVTLDESDLKTESNLDNLPENSSNMTEKVCDQLGSSNMDETIKDCDKLGSSNMDETIKDCDKLGSSNMDETETDCDQLDSLNVAETEKDCDQLGSSELMESEKECDQSTGKSELNEDIQSPRNKNDAENINNLNKREEKVDSNDGTVQDIDKKVKALNRAIRVLCRVT